MAKTMFKCYDRRGEFVCYEFAADKTTALRYASVKFLRVDYCEAA